MAKRKLLPALYRLYYNDRLDCVFKIISAGLPELSTKQYHKFIEESIADFSSDIYEKNIVETFKENIEFIGLDFEVEYDFNDLKQKIKNTADSMNLSKPNVIYYLAVPPNFLKQL